MHETLCTSLSKVAMPCTFLTSHMKVPLDYADPLKGVAGIAIIRSPSSIPPSSEGYKGPILFNPGAHDLGEYRCTLTSWYGTQVGLVGQV